jgi:hypothetical protein
LAHVVEVLARQSLAHWGAPVWALACALAKMPANATRARMKVDAEMDFIVSEVIKFGVWCGSDGCVGCVGVVVFLVWIESDEAPLYMRRARAVS